MRHLPIFGYWILGIGLLFAGCTQPPQRVRKLNQTEPLDSAMMAQMTFNTQMADAADRACREWVKNDSVQYAIDNFGFWYAKTKKMYSDTLKKGDNVLAHIHICELNGTLLADVEDYFSVGSSNLPIAINRSMKQMSYGEVMRIVAPWYTAYGAEGTSLIKPYSNLVITLTIIEE